MDIEFSSEKELYERLKPALLTKASDFKRKGISYISIEDIWNYLKISKWANSKNLLLYQMVDDIINIDDMLVDNYVKDEIAKRHKKPIFDYKNDN